MQRCKYGMICDVASGAVPVLFMLLIRTVFVSSNTGNKQLTLFSVKKIYSEYIFSRKLSTDFVQIGSLDRKEIINTAVLGSS